MRCNGCFLSFLFLAVTSLSDGAAALERMQVRGQWIVDKSGRVRLFHGFNSVQKGPPWFDRNILNLTRLQLYRDFGFNVVRLGAMWKGVVPRPNQFDPSYIETLQKIVTSLEDHGMYVILDMHQDVLSVFNTSTEWVGYEGVPRWLIDRFPPPRHPYPWPFVDPPPTESWALGYFAEAVSLAFQQIYDDVSGAVGFMSDFWVKLARSFKDSSSVLGYELINEPWAGNIFNKMSDLLPGVAGRDNLMPLYDRLNSAIRAVDGNALIFYEPVTWGIFNSDGVLGTGFKSVPGGSAYNNRSVLSYHYYCWILGDPAKSFPLYERVICDVVLGPQMMRSIAKDVEKIGGSSFLTEFGLCAPDGRPDSINTIECEFVMSLADDHLQSWTYWDSSFFEDNGDVNWDVVKPFARVYARAVAGIPTKMTFNLDSRKFRLEYTIDLAIEAATEIFVPLVHFPNGFNVTTSSQLKWKFDERARVLYVTRISFHTLFFPVAFVDVVPCDKRSGCL